MADDNNDVQADKDDIVIDKDEVIESDKTPSIDFTIEVLPFIKEAQNQHGLKHGDYQRYRLYCSRRLRRIRKSLHFTHGHRNRYHKRPITAAVITDVRYLYILLISAERAWSAAMELKQLSNTEPRKKFHLIRKLRKAVKYSHSLMGLCEEMDGCDARTKLEVTAYWQWLNGNILFEQQSWQKALDSFGDSRNIYQKLGNAVSDDQRSLYHQRVEEITPNIRYCAYNIGGLPTDVSELMKLRSDAVGSDMLSAKIDEVLAKTSEKAAVALTEVQWEGKSIPVKNEKIRVCLIKLNQMAREIEMVEGREEKMEVFEKLLMEYQDAIQVVKDEIHQDSIADKKKSQKTEQLKSTYQNLLDYLVHQKLTQGIQRNLLLLETLEESKFGQKSAKPEEFVRVYDILLQQITELGDLQSSDLNQQKFLIGQTFYCKANRCYYLSETYTAMRKWMEGIALLERALEHNIQSVEHFRGCDIPDSQQYVSKLQKLREIIHGRKCELKVNNVLDSQNLEDSMGHLSLQDKPITSQLDYHNLTSVGLSMGNVTLSPIPSEYKPLPTKPLFFDLALDHIEFPPLAHRAEKRGGSGLTGFVKGLFWGKN